MKCIVNVSTHKSSGFSEYLERHSINYTVDYNSSFNYGSYDFTLDTEDAIFLKLKFPNLVILFEKYYEIFISGKRVRMTIPNSNPNLKSKIEILPACHSTQ